MTAYRALLGFLLSFAFGLIMLALLAGCSFSMTVGTGNRQAGTWAEHSEIPATIKEIAPLAEAAAQGAVKGIKGTP